jgi:hypothetical protein
MNLDRVRGARCKSSSHVQNKLCPFASPERGSHSPARPVKSSRDVRDANELDLDLVPTLTNLSDTCSSNHAHIDSSLGETTGPACIKEAVVRTGESPTATLTFVGSWQHVQSLDNGSVE